MVHSGQLEALFHLPSDHNFVGEDPSFLESVALILVPLSYVYTFAATQGLISVIDDAYGNMFVVFLNACFFLPGLPCALLQSWYDVKVDMQYSSFYTFQFRMIVCYAILLICSGILTSNREQVTLLVLTSLVGIATWFAHGTCTQLVQLFPARAMVQVQLGFQMSNILALVLVLALQVTTYDIDDSQIDYFYIIVVCVVCAGCISWLAFLQRANEPEERLNERDTNLAAKPLLDEDPTSESPLLSAALSLDTLPEEHAELFSADCKYLVIAIFTNIFSSNLMGAFFAYVPEDEIPKIATALVFCRLISDALSRVVAYVWRPFFCANPRTLFYTSMIRAGSVAVFFAYVAGAFTADWFIMLFVVASGFISGINSTYAYVASREICLVLPAEYQEEAFAQTSFYMNISFNSGGFVSSLVSIAIALTIRYAINE